MRRQIPVISEELQALVDERARSTGDNSLALTALYLRSGMDDFVSDGALMLDVIRSQAAELTNNVRRVSECVEKVELKLARDGLESIVEALEPQLAFARRLAEYVQKDLDQAERDARGEGGSR